MVAGAMWEQIHQVFLLHCGSGPADNNLLPSYTSFFPTVVIRIVLLLSSCLSRVNEATRPQHSWRKGRHWWLICIFLAHSMDIFTPSWWGSSIIHNPCLLQQGRGHTEMTEGWFIVRRLPSFSDYTLLLLRQVKPLQRLPALCTLEFPKWQD